jgi:alpha-tubulin suppressor-like RCC1 family protein
LLLSSPGPNACHYFAITTDGGVYAWGRNERGQLGNGSTTNVYVPALIAGVPRIAAVSAGKGHTLLLTEGGDVLAAGDNKMGQCSQGKNKVGDAPILKFTTVSGLPAGRITAIAAGADFSIAVADGKLYSAGSQEYGQCGTGTDGVWIVSAGRTAVQEVPAFETIPVEKTGAAGVRFSAVAAGANHAVGLTVDGRVFTWGCVSRSRRRARGTLSPLTSPLSLSLSVQLGCVRAVRARQHGGRARPHRRQVL